MQPVVKYSGFLPIHTRMPRRHSEAMWTNRDNKAPTSIGSSGTPTNMGSSLVPKTSLCDIFFPSFSRGYGSLNHVNYSLFQSYISYIHNLLDLRWFLSISEMRFIAFQKGTFASLLLKINGSRDTCSPLFSFSSASLYITGTLAYISLLILWFDMERITATLEPEGWGLQPPPHFFASVWYRTIDSVSYLR